MQRRGNFVAGVSLFVLGGWLVASGLGVPMPGFEQIWPAFLVAFGLTMFARTSDTSSLGKESVFVGVGAILTGLFLLLFTLGTLEWRELALYWPAIPLIVGVAYFALYLARGMVDTGLLVPAFIVGGLGALAFPFTLGAVQNPFLSRLVWLLPGLAVLLGLVFMFRPEQRPERIRVVSSTADALPEEEASAGDSPEEESSADMVSELEDEQPTDESSPDTEAPVDHPPLDVPDTGEQSPDDDELGSEAFTGFPDFEDPLAETLDDAEAPSDDSTVGEPLTDASYTDGPPLDESPSEDEAE
jgi:hypothetical protein